MTDPRMRDVLKVVQGGAEDRLRVDRPSGGGDDGGMEPPLRAIEDRLLKLEVRSENFATKTDVAEAKTAIIIWVVTAVFIAQLLPPIVGLFAKHFGV